MLSKICELKTKQEQEEYLRDLIRFLIHSSEAYDAGYDGEAQRLAVAIRAIFEDPDGSGSLYAKLCQGLYLYDNSPDHNPAIDLPFSGLAVFSRKGKAERYLPRLGRNPGVPFKKTGFDEWWGKLVICDTKGTVKITRRDVIYSVSNTYGNYNLTGTKPALDQEFNSLILQNPIGWVDERMSIGKDYQEIVFASTRQIAFELLEAFAEQIPQYFPPMPKPPEQGEEG